MYGLSRNNLASEMPWDFKKLHAIIPILGGYWKNRSTKIKNATEKNSRAYYRSHKV